MLLPRTKEWLRRKGWMIEPGHPLFGPLHKTYTRINNLGRLKGSLGTLPDFVVIGAQKAGTTSLFNYLLQHPRFHSPVTKDPHFFDHNYGKGLSWYRSFFPLQGRQSLHEYLLGQTFITGEVSTSYIWFYQTVPARIKTHLPNIRLIALLRDPVDRAFSMYQHLLYRGKEPCQTFEEAIRAEKARAKQTARNQEELQRLNDQRYIERGKYYTQLKHWYRAFSPDHILVIKSEELFAHLQPTMDRIFSFLGLESYPIRTHAPVNRGIYKSRMDPETRKRLKTYYKPYNKKLYRLIGRDMGWEDEQ